MSGSPSNIHLWFTYTDEIDDRSLLAQYLTLLPRLEQDNFQRFHFPQHQKRYLIGRALVRSVISAWTSIPPQAIVFHRETYGRPYIIPPENSRTIDFNLSYTDGIAALALATNAKVGIDVEMTDTDFDVQEIASTYFSAAEKEELESLPDGDARRERFYELWTMKEACLKASGSGLTTSLDEICCASIKNCAGSLQRFVLQPDKVNFYQVGLYEPSAHHKAAICVSDKGGTPIEVKIKKIIPLVEESEYRLDHY